MGGWLGSHLGFGMRMEEPKKAVMRLSNANGLPVDPPGGELQVRSISRSFCPRTGVDIRHSSGSARDGARVMRELPRLADRKLNPCEVGTAYVIKTKETGGKAAVHFEAGFMGRPANLSRSLRWRIIPGGTPGRDGMSSACRSWSFCGHSSRGLHVTQVSKPRFGWSIKIVVMSRSSRHSSHQASPPCTRHTRIPLAVLQPCPKTRTSLTSTSVLSTSRTRLPSQPISSSPRR